MTVTPRNRRLTTLLRAAGGAIGGRLRGAVSPAAAAAAAAKQGRMEQGCSAALQPRAGMCL